ncbi:MAG: PaaI family thioesterase [Prevotella sp.]|uniref:PaaI family thioesterase n=1 Tax=Prevotella sp. TaxID=59823 RepID=UPI002A280209|nr:PaaI family thioesterase [Prevotella sp.]MDD7317182.1 PaaI family thioesterase [Prevotellaceae bacterium]MDY4019785.1 PaaI family thioesterase [Prevotella sp.]
MDKIQNPWLQVPGYSCPGCSPTNEKGLKLQFWEECDDIVSYWQPELSYQSWKNTLHGGIQCMMLDEVAGWVVFRKLQTMGVTSRIDTKYIKPMTIVDKVEMRARITKRMRQVVFIESELWQNGELCTCAEVTYFCSTPEFTCREYGFKGCFLEKDIQPLSSYQVSPRIYSEEDEKEECEAPK